MALTSSGGLCLTYMLRKTYIDHVRASALKLIHVGMFEFGFLPGIFVVPLHPSFAHGTWLQEKETKQTGKMNVSDVNRQPKSFSSVNVD